jgi:hypothetical protein
MYSNYTWEGILAKGGDLGDTRMKYCPTWSPFNNNPESFTTGPNAEQTYGESLDSNVDRNPPTKGSATTVRFLRVNVIEKPSFSIVLEYATLGTAAACAAENSQRYVIRLQTGGKSGFFQPRYGVKGIVLMADGGFKAVDAAVYDKMPCEMWALTGASGTSTVSVLAFDKNGTINNIL